MRDLAQRIQEVWGRIRGAAHRVGRDPESVRLVAVTKTVPPDQIREAWREGIREVGENRVQEALPKMEALSDLSLTWHFVGHLQRNKVRYVVGRFALIHSVDDLELLEALDRRAQHQGVVQPILLQVNVAREASKYGFFEEDLPLAIERCRGLSGISLEGLMTIPPLPEHPEQSRPYYRRLRELRDQWGLRELSMGMTLDFEVAVEEGATLVRIGTALFGARE